MISETISRGPKSSRSKQKVIKVMGLRRILARTVSSILSGSPRFVLTETTLFRTLSAVVCTAAVLFVTACDNSGTERSASSGLFVSPVPLAANSNGINTSTGEKRVDTVVSLVEIAKASNAAVQPNLLDPDNPFIILPPANAVSDEILDTFVLGKLSDTKYLLYERNSTTILKVDISRRPALDLLNINTYLVRSDILKTLTSSAAAFQLDTVLNVFDDVVLGFENASSQLFTLREAATGAIDMNVLLTETDIRTQTRRESLRFLSAAFLPSRSVPLPAGVKRVAEVLLLPNRGTGPLADVDQDVQLLVVTEKNDGTLEGKFSVFDSSGDLIPEIGLIPPIDPNDPDRFRIDGFVQFASIRNTTDSFDLDIFEFKPAVIPSRNGIVLFDKVTLSFVEATFERNSVPPMSSDDPEIGAISKVSTVELFSLPGEVAATVLSGGASGELKVDFQNTVPHGTRPILLTFEEESDNMIALNYGVELGQARVSIFAGASSFTLRRDTLGGNLETSADDPAFSMGFGNLRGESELIFDRGSDELLTLHFDTGNYVVLLKQVDLARETGILGISDLTYVEAIDDGHVLAFDSQGTTLVEIRVTYAAFPIRFPTNL